MSAVDRVRRCGLTVGAVGVLWLGTPSAIQAAPIIYNSTNIAGSDALFTFGGLTDDWLLIGTASGSFGTTVSVNSGFELGAHLPLDGLVPTDGSPDIGDVTKPAGATSPTIGIGLNGDTALTNTSGTFNFQDLDGASRLGATTGRSGIYGDTGVQCSQSATGCTSGNSNNFFNSTGVFPMPNSPLSTSNGILGGSSATLSGLRDELTAYSNPLTGISGLPSDGTLLGGTFSGDLTINLLNSGIHVLDVAATGDWNLGNFDIVVNGSADSFLIIRIPDGVNMLTSNSWIGIGTGGIGTNNILFYTDQSNNNGHFNFNNTVFNGVSFWDLSSAGADLSVSNGQGCAQFISDQIVMNNVRFNNCAFSPTTNVPEPAMLLLLSSGLTITGVRRYRRCVTSLK